MNLAAYAKAGNSLSESSFILVCKVPCSCLLLQSCKKDIQATNKVKLITAEDRKVIYRIKLQNTSTLTDSAVTQLQRDAENSG